MEVIYTYTLKWVSYDDWGFGLYYSLSGGILLQWLQLVLVACMSLVMPGQKMELSALEIIEEMP